MTERDELLTALKLAHSWMLPREFISQANFEEARAKVRAVIEKYEPTRGATASRNSKQESQDGFCR